ncbi:LCP family protein [Tomitella fengzijianii]|uniref:LytR family transcriptional regulator n=1 Tax=Tomitella fengzijianii TaxID=2597660 RepID=A0A516WZY8_9ACTN|nr:LCP family protein [Tomitella fengzijianii]QDQ96307.1 LytR family transcriptional regulator [Tomitella fengzijianii]
MVAAARVFAACASAVVLLATGVAWWQWNDINGAISTSDALDGVSASEGKERNTLIIGLDSRLDKDGKPLPQEVYDRIHAGDESVGGYNANTLMLVHVGADGRAKIIGIPRDDYVEIPGCPNGVCQAKIKESYGHAFSEYRDAHENSQDGAALERGAREAGRKSVTATVSRFLGDVPIDDFVEVTMGAFYELASTVEPITVCLQHDTYDPFSGADFRAGEQQIDAAQAMAFVRQRRDVNPDLNFTDIDRSRRQQAFLLSVAKQLGGTNLVTDSGARGRLTDIARSHLTLDKNLDLAGAFALASSIDPATVESYTLPITGFATLDDGTEVNTVDTAEIRRTVALLLQPSTAGPDAGAEAPPGPDAEPARAVLDVSATRIDVANATGIDGLAGALADGLAAEASTHGRGPGAATTAEAVQNRSAVRFAPGDRADALSLAGFLGIDDVTEDATVTPGALRFVAGLDIVDNPVARQLTASAPAALRQEFSVDAAPDQSDPDAGGPPPPAALSTSEDPQPTDLSQIASGGVPCVK